MKPADDNTAPPQGGGLTLLQKLGYGIGAMTENNMQNAVSNLTMPIMNDLMGVKSVYLGYVAAIGRVFDSITDPLMGYISDKTHGRWGRRKPYILSGSVLAAVAFFCVWLFPLSGWSGHRLLYYFLAMSLVYYLCTTIYCVPYISYGYELSQDYHERTQLMGFRMFFVSLGNVLLRWVYWFTQRRCFSNTLQGMRVAALGLGALFVLCALGPLLLTGRAAAPERREARLKRIRLADIVSVFRVRPFRCVALCLALGVFGVISISSLNFYIIMYYVCNGDKGFGGTLLGLNGTLGGILGVASLPLITRISRRLGKRLTLVIFLLIGVIGSALNWILYTPRAPYLSVLQTVFYTPALTALWMLLFSMMADVCDYDEYHNHLRREGIFAAVLSWVGKVGITLGVVAGGYILVWTGYNQTPGAVQTAQTLLNMRLYYVIVPTVGLALAALALAPYALGARKVAELKAALASRREPQPAGGDDHAVD